MFVLICWYYEVWARVRKLKVNAFFEFMSTSAVDIDRRPISEAKPIWQSGPIPSHKTINDGRHNRLAEHGSP